MPIWHPLSRRPGEILADLGDVKNKPGSLETLIRELVVELSTMAEHVGGDDVLLRLLEGALRGLLASHQLD